MDILKSPSNDYHLDTREAIKKELIYKSTVLKKDLAQLHDSSVDLDHYLYKRKLIIDEFIYNRESLINQYHVINNNNDFDFLLNETEYANFEKISNLV